jgi:hypothetical protein
MKLLQHTQRRLQRQHRQKHQRKKQTANNLI